FLQSSYPVFAKLIQGHRRISCSLILKHISSAFFYQTCQRRISIRSGNTCQLCRFIAGQPSFCQQGQIQRSFLSGQIKISKFFNNIHISPSLFLHKNTISDFSKFVKANLYFSYIYEKQQNSSAIKIVVIASIFYDKLINSAENYFYN